MREPAAFISLDWALEWCKHWITNSKIGKLELVMWALLCWHRQHGSRCLPSSGVRDDVAGVRCVEDDKTCSVGRAREEYGGIYVLVTATVWCHPNRHSGHNGEYFVGMLCQCKGIVLSNQYHDKHIFFHMLRNEPIWMVWLWRCDALCLLPVYDISM